MPPGSQLDISDLAAVVYSCGKVFDGLRTGRLDTIEFLKNGNTAGVSSRHDLELLQDLRDAAEFIIEHRGDAITPEFVKAVNAQIARSGSLEPGRFRRAEQNIGVDTVYGEHRPQAVDDRSLQKLIDAALAKPDLEERAIALFLGIAKAQPFGDGNKRTAIFVANALLIREADPVLMTVPYRDNDPQLAELFNDSLAQYYIFGDVSPVTDLFRLLGFGTPQRLRERRNRSSDQRNMFAHGQRRREVAEAVQALKRSSSEDDGGVR